MPAASIATLVLALAAGEPPAPSFVVIAPNAFHDALRPFVEHKNAIGMATHLASLEAILVDPAGMAEPVRRSDSGTSDPGKPSLVAASPSIDAPERLKRWLFDRWRAGARYALLVGDADVLPVRYMVLDRVTPAAFDFAFYPSDLYYADLARADGSFEDWNARRDGFHAGYFGEVRGERNKEGPINADGIDYRPEIAVGRWPVSTPEDAARVAAKSIRAEQAARDGTHGGFDRSLFIHCDGWVDAKPLFDRLAARLADRRARSGPHESTTVVEKRYDGTDAPPNEAAVIEALDRGVALVLHGGHGQPDGWERSLHAGAIARLNNADRLPVVMSVGCSTAQFATLPPYEAYVDVDGREHEGTNAGEVFEAPPPPPAPFQRGAMNTTGLGERLLRESEQGAVAYIGCNTGSQPCALSLMEGFVEAAASASVDGPIRLGDCWNAALRHYVRRERLMELVPTESWYPPSIFFQGMKFMLFGDPTLEMATGPR